MQVNEILAYTLCRLVSIDEPRIGRRFDSMQRCEIQQKMAESSSTGTEEK